MFYNIYKTNTASYSFVLSQLRASSRQCHGRRWSAKEKSFYLNIYFQSPSTYKLLSRMMPLPCKNTLLRSVSRLIKSPGFCSNFISTLQKISQSMTQLEKFCVFVFDEISIKSGLKYDAHLDAIVGFPNYGPKVECDTKNLAKHALVFMIRGLSRQWK